MIHEHGIIETTGRVEACGREPEEQNWKGKEDRSLRKKEKKALDYYN